MEIAFLSKITSSYFNIEEKLNDASNFTTWSDILDLTLEEIDVMEYVEGNVVETPESAITNVKSKYKKCEVKAKKIIVDSLKDHIITYVSKLKNSKDMYNMLIGMYEVNNLNHIISFKIQLRDIKMTKQESIIG